MINDLGRSVNPEPGQGTCVIRFITHNQWIGLHREVITVFFWAAHASEPCFTAYGSRNGQDRSVLKVETVHQHQMGSWGELIVLS